MQAAIGAGLAGRVQARSGICRRGRREEPLNAVIVNPAGARRLSIEERARVIDALQRATWTAASTSCGRSSARAGWWIGVARGTAIRYQGWEVTVERSDGRTKTFFARKGPRPESPRFNLTRCVRLPCVRATPLAIHRTRSIRVIV